MASAREPIGLWPVHLKPKDDELLSSWLVRLARAHGLKLHTFCSLIWPGKQIWNRDIDKSDDREIVEVLSARTGVSIERARATTLAVYESILYEKHNRFGPSSWIMPIGVYHRIRTKFGLQYCAQCLAEDKDPYYRRKWRLAFIVLCERHHTLLQDRCPKCGTAVNFHREEMGNHRKFVSNSLTVCYSCRSELRAVEGSHIDTATSAEIEFTTILLQAIDDGFVRLNEGLSTYSYLYFTGLRQLMKVIAMRNKRVSKLRQLINIECGGGSFSLQNLPVHSDVGELNVELRRQLLKIARYLLEEWPHRFIEISRKCKIWSSIWLRHLDPPARPHTLPTPFWLWSVVHDHLYRAKYCPSDGEIKAAIDYLKMTGKVVNKSTIARILGVAVVRRRNIEHLFVDKRR